MRDSLDGAVHFVDESMCSKFQQVEAYQANIIMPNRHVDEHGASFNGHLLSSETYVGGHVEALEAGVFRSDIPTPFKLDPQAIQQVSSTSFRDK